MKRRLIISLFIIVITIGCSRVPQVDADNIEYIEDITVEEGTAGDCNFSKDNWWTMYEDKNLDSLVEVILESNIDLDIAKINLEKTEEGLNKIKGAKAPTATIYGGAKRVKVEDAKPGSLEGGRADIYTGGLLVNYNLDVFHKIDSLHRSQEFLIKGRKLQKDLVKLEITTLVTRLYGYYIYLNNINENLIESLEVLREVDSMVTKGIEIGQNIEEDLLRVESRINNLEGAIAENRVAQRNILESLNLLSDYKRTGDVKKLLEGGKETSEILNLKMILPEKIASTVVSNRPDVKYYLMVIEAQRYKLKSLKADYYPQFSITGNLNKTKIDFKNGFTPSALAWSLGPRVYLPIFNMSQVKADYRIAGLELKEFIKEYDKTLMTAFKDINIELAANRALERTARLKDKNLEISDKILRNGEIEVEAGALSKYKLLLRRYDNLRAQSERETSRYKAYKEQISLIKSLGGVYRKTGSSEEDLNGYTEEERNG